MARSDLVPPALFVGQGIAQYVGASLAVSLFARTLLLRNRITHD